jgi:hypothetical protein
MWRGKGWWHRLSSLWKSPGPFPNEGWEEKNIIAGNVDCRYISTSGTFSN